MKTESDKNELQDRSFQKDGSQQIDRDHIFRMQDVIAYAAPSGVKNGIGQQVVQVHQHGGQQDEPVPFPVLLIIPVSNGTDHKEMQGIMNKGLKHGLNLWVFIS